MSGGVACGRDDVEILGKWMNEEKISEHWIHYAQLSNSSIVSRLFGYRSLVRSRRACWISF